MGRDIVRTARPNSLIQPDPNNLGIETKDGTFTPVIGGQWTISSCGSLILTTVNDNQTRVEVHVLRGKSDRAADNQSLAKFELTGITPAPRGVAQIVVAFKLDVNGTISVSAQEEATGRRQSMTIRSGGLTQAEVQRLVEETRARAASERNRMDRDALVRRLDGLLADTVRSVHALEGKLTSEEQKGILEAIEKAEKEKSDGSLDELRGRLADLEKAATVVGQAMLRP